MSKRVFDLHAQMETTDCGVAVEVCRQISNIEYLACIANDCPESDCAWMAASFTNNCIRQQGCPLPRTDGVY